MSMGVIAGVVGVGTAVYGASQSASAARRAARAQEQALAGSQTQLNPFSVFGPGGMSAGWAGPQDPLMLSSPEANGQGGMSDAAARFLGRIPGTGAANNRQQPGVNLNAGDLEGLRAALSQYASGRVPSGSGQLPTAITGALGQLQSASGAPLDMGTGGLDFLDSATRQQLEAAQQSLGQAQGGFQRPLQSTAFAGAGSQLQQALSGQRFQGGLQDSAFAGAQNQFDSLNQTYGQVYDTTLGNLRSQADEQNQRAFAGLQNNQFATGRLGSTGGALQTEAFAKGLAGADAGFQLQAQQQAQMAQQNALGLGQGLLGAGQGLRGQQDQIAQNQMGLAQGSFGMGTGLVGQEDALLNSAFGRFGQSSQLAADLNRERFSRSMYGNEQGYQRANNMLGTQINLAGLPSSLDAAQLGNMNTALQGQSGIQQQLLQLFGAGLSTEQAAANARIGAGSNMAQIVGSPSFGAPQQANAAMWSQLGSSMLNPNGMGGALGNLFNQFGSTSVQSPNYNDLQFPTMTGNEWRGG